MHTWASALNVSYIHLVGNEPAFMNTMDCVVVCVQEIWIVLWVNKLAANNLPTDRKFHLPIILSAPSPQSLPPSPLWHWLCHQYGADERSWQLTSLDQYHLISMSGERRKEQEIDWATRREGKSEHEKDSDGEKNPVWSNSSAWPVEV